MLRAILGIWPFCTDCLSTKPSWMLFAGGGESPNSNCSGPCSLILRAPRTSTCWLPFAEDAGWGLFEHEHMENELAGLLGRSVDLVSRRAIEASGNALRRNSILANAVPVYVSG